MQFHFYLFSCIQHALRRQTQKNGFSKVRVFVQPLSSEQFFASADENKTSGEKRKQHNRFSPIVLTKNDVRRQTPQKENESNGCTKSLIIAFREPEITDTQNGDESAGCTKSLKRHTRRASRPRQERSKSTHRASRQRRELSKSARGASTQRRKLREVQK